MKHTHSMVPNKSSVNPLQDGPAQLYVGLYTIKKKNINYSYVVYHKP